MNLVAAPPAALTREQAVRFLHRSTFGGSPAEVEQLIAEGVSTWFDREVATEPNNRLHGLLTRDDRWGESVWKRYLSGNAPLRKRMGYALSQIFVTSRNGADGYAVAHYADLLERNAFTTYRELLEVITKSVAMGQYLTYSYNIKADPVSGQQPDENYAREILQLFSIGLVQLNQNGTPRLDSGGNTIDTYGQDDVRGLARVFTGWYPDTPRFEYPERMRYPMINNDNWHEFGEKRFLGVTIPEGANGTESLRLALDAIAAHPNVGPFIGRQLIQRLVTSNPRPAYVRRVADVFDDDGNGVRGNLEAVTRAVLTDDDAWNDTPGPTVGKLREPVLRFTIVMRALGASSSQPIWPLRSTENPADELGQMPYESRSVFNFYRPGYVPPRTSLADQGLVAPEFQIANESSVIGWVNYLGRILQRPPNGLNYNLATLRPLTNDPSALVDELDARLTGGRLAADTAALIVDTIDRTTNRDAARQQTERINAAVLLIAASTDFLYER